MALSFLGPLALRSTLPPPGSFHLPYWPSESTLFSIFLFLEATPRTGVFAGIREIKFDVTWSYVKRQTANMTSEFVFFSFNPSLNHIKIENCLLLFPTNTNIFTLLFNELETDGKSFIFAVCGLTYDHVTSNLISLIIQCLLKEKLTTIQVIAWMKSHVSECLDADLVALKCQHFLVQIIKETGSLGKVSIITRRNSILKEVFPKNPP